MLKIYSSELCKVCDRLAKTNSSICYRCAEFFKSTVVAMKTYQCFNDSRCIISKGSKLKNLCFSPIWRAKSQNSWIFLTL